MTPDITTDFLALLTRLDEKVTHIGGVTEKLTASLDLLVSQRTVKDKYTTAEVATIVGKSDWTVRNWCNKGRVNAEKAETGRGDSQEWRISHQELTRYLNDGLLPERK